MLKSSKWAPWQPSEDYLDSLEQRAASSQVAGNSHLHEPDKWCSADLCPDAGDGNLHVSLAGSSCLQGSWLPSWLGSLSLMREASLQVSRSGMVFAEWAPDTKELWARQQTELPLQTIRQIHQNAGDLRACRCTLLTAYRRWGTIALPLYPGLDSPQTSSPEA